MLELDVNRSLDADNHNRDPNPEFQLYLADNSTILGSHVLLHGSHSLDDLGKLGLKPNAQAHPQGWSKRSSDIVLS